MRGLRETDAPALAGGDPSEYLVHRGALGEPTKFTREVLLERLPMLVGTGLQPEVDVLWQVSDQHVWHAYIMQASPVSGNE